MNTFNQEPNDGVIISERKIVPTSTYRRIGLGFFVLIFLVGLAWAVLQYLYAPQLLQEQFANTVTDELEQVLTPDATVNFTIVPDAATTTILGSVPTQTTESLASDFTMARDMATKDAEGKPAEETLENIVIGSVPYPTLADTLPDEAKMTLYQMHDELREVVRILAPQYQTDPLATRVGEPDALLYPGLAVVFGGEPAVYPSPYALEGYMVTELLAIAYPETAAYYRERGEEYVRNGIAYGHYSVEELNVMKAYTSWYIGEAQKNPAFAELITSIKATQN